MNSTTASSETSDRLAKARAQLDRDGFTLLEQAIPKTLLDRLNARIDELFVIEGESAGAEFKQEAGCQRLANLVNKGPVFQEVVIQRDVLSLVGSVLGEFKLSSLNVRSVNAGNMNRQPLHADMGAVPDQHGAWVCNALWMLDDITTENGPLRVVPGTHRSGKLPQEECDALEDHSDQQIVTGDAGSIVVFNAHLWHGGTENRTTKTRRALHAFYCRSDQPQQQYQKSLLDPTVAKEMPVELRRLLALDDPVNDQLSSRVSKTSGFME
jgi:hypothetical protein